MASVTITEAAKLANISRKTIYAHINKGKVSCRTDKNGARKIDMAELVRVYNVTLPGNSKVTDKVTSEVTSGNVTSNSIVLSPEQLELIIKNAVAEAIKEVVPVLLEHKEIETKTAPIKEPVATEEIKTYEAPSLGKVASNYVDDMPSFGKK